MTEIQLDSATLWHLCDLFDKARDTEAEKLDSDLARIRSELSELEAAELAAPVGSSERAKLAREASVKNVDWYEAFGRKVGSREGYKACKFIIDAALSEAVSRVVSESRAARTASTEEDGQ